MDTPVDGIPPSQALALRQMHEILIDRFRGKQIRIFEAGGGSASCLPLSSFDHPKITVVDIDETQLRNNSYASDKILGDIQTYSFPPNSFDLVVCYNVIEHLDSPDKAITQFDDALAPGGLLVIAAPNPESLSGMVTRLTPHWFHVWFYRHILGDKNAGQPGAHPFPTVFHRVVSPNALREFCEKRGLEVIYFKQYEGVTYSRLRERPLIGRLLAAATGVMNALMLGRRDLRQGDYHVIFQKLGTSVAH